LLGHDLQAKRGLYQNKLPIQTVRTDAPEKMENYRLRGEEFSRVTIRLGFDG
jgi:hypothetical protein